MLHSCVDFGRIVQLNKYIKIHKKNLKNTFLTIRINILKNLQHTPKKTDITGINTAEPICYFYSVNSGMSHHEQRECTTTTYRINLRR
jgi:hypothetical protein